VQKFTVLELVVILLGRERASCAIILEALLSNWTEASLAIVAASKGQSDLVQAFLVGAIAINHLLLLGICFIQGGHHGRRTSYSMLMASLHIRMLPMYIVLMLPPIAFEVGSQGMGFQSIAPQAHALRDSGSDGGVVRTARITALLLLLLFICHLVLVCRKHSTYPLGAHGLHKLAYAHDSSVGTEPLAYGTNIRITASMASRIQAQKENWLWEQLLLSDTAADSRKTWDSALTTVTLLPCLMLPAGRFDFARQLVCGVIMSTSQLLCLILPATILTRWIVSSVANVPHHLPHRGHVRTCGPHSKLCTYCTGQNADCALRSSVPYRPVFLKLYSFNSSWRDWHREVIHGHLVYDWEAFLANAHPPAVWVLHQFGHVWRRGGSQLVLIEAVKILIKLRCMLLPLEAPLAYKEVIVYKHYVESPVVTSVRPRHLARAWELWQLVVVVVSGALSGHILGKGLSDRLLGGLVP
ncbi:hypothetical protein PSPO01_15515, partial [Paraphaeosphaeria sporulosa]